MGCNIPNNGKVTVPINNSIMHLLQTEQDEELMKKLSLEDRENFKTRLNFRGDTIMHFACFKNNVKLVKYLKDNGADFTIKNDNDQIPSQMSSNIEIKTILSGTDSTQACEKSIDDPNNPEIPKNTGTHIGEIKVFIPGKMINNSEEKLKNSEGQSLPAVSLNKEGSKGKSKESEA